MEEKYAQIQYDGDDLENVSVKEVGDVPQTGKDSRDVDLDGIQGIAESVREIVKKEMEEKNSPMAEGEPPAAFGASSAAAQPAPRQVSRGESFFRTGNEPIQVREPLNRGEGYFQGGQPQWGRSAGEGYFQGGQPQWEGASQEGHRPFGEREFQEGHKPLGEKEFQKGHKTSVGVSPSEKSEGANTQETGKASGRANVQETDKASEGMDLQEAHKAPGGVDLQEAHKAPGGVDLQEAHKAPEGADTQEIRKVPEGASHLESNQAPQSVFSQKSNQEPQGAFPSESNQAPQSVFSQKSNQEPQGAFSSESNQEPQGAFSSESNQEPQGASAPESGKDSQGASAPESGKDSQGAFAPESGKDSQGADSQETAAALDARMGRMEESLENMSRVMRRLEKKFETEILNSETRDNTVKTIYKELNEYKAGLVEKAMKEVLYDFIDIREMMFSKAKYMQKEGAEAVISLEEFLSYAEDIGDILEKHDVLIYKGEPGVRNVATRQKIVRKIETEDEALAKTVAESLSYGYEYNGKVIYPEKISVYVKKK